MLVLNLPAACFQPELDLFSLPLHPFGIRIAFLPMQHDFIQPSGTLSLCSGIGRKGSKAGAGPARSMLPA